MKTLYPAMMIALLSNLSLAQVSSEANVSKCNQYDTVNITPTTRTYIVQNNIWNNINGSQCINVDGLTGNFRITSSNHNKPLNGPPASYPSIFKGCHWSRCTNSARSVMPKQISTLLSATTNWITTQPNLGVYNVVYDLWLSQTPIATGQPDGAEIMIWLNRKGDIQPEGRFITTTSVNGTTWDIWVGNKNGVRVLSYVRTTGVTSVRNLNIKAFLDDAHSRDYIRSAWYLIAVEAGFEIWQNGVGLQSRSFSVLVE